MKNIIITAILFGSGFLSQAQEVGLQLYSLRDQFKVDVSNTLGLIEEWGITNIEGGGTYDMPMEDFKTLLAEHNLNMVSVGAQFGDLENDIDKVVKNAKAFGATYVMCAWVPHDDNKWDLEETQHATDVFNKAGKILKKNGLTLAYHAHGYEFRPYKNATLFDYMAEHAKDFSFELDVSNVVLGTGQVDISGIVAEAKKLGIKYMFIEDESSDVVSQVPKSLEYLSQLEK